MKRVKLSAACLVAIFILAIIPTGCTKPPTTEEIKATVEISDVQTNWTKKIYQSWPPKLTIVPTISFRVKNTSDKPLRNTILNAIFRLKDEPDNLGDGFLLTFKKKALMPGERSEVITLKSNFGVEGKNLNHIQNSPQWKIAFVKLFARIRGSQYILMGEWEVSREIDFKEPEPFVPQKKDKN